MAPSSGSSTSWSPALASPPLPRCSLPPDLRARTGIYANDFGQGGAIDFYGPALGLPKAIGGHLTFWYWGPRGYTGRRCARG